MYIAKIVGMVISTSKDENLVGKKILIVQPVNTKYEPSGNTEVAVDCVGAGAGEYVLVTTGSSARNVFENSKSPIDRAIVAIIDNIQVSP
ncbi:EutN/CcmL family microcompartment protein [Wukongibacter baidiensis]|uniref:EutN/CcmL family microcompartment protein n=1 Tax=Wukongibacter baidiensis TaxID=1723361 RepID=UPI003D7F7FF9